MFPEVSVQSLATSWWEIDSSATIGRGRLLKVIVPYPEMKPYRLVPIGRGADVLATSGLAVPAELRAGAARWQSTSTLLLAPYYGATSDGTRGGWNPAFVGRIQRVEYSQYVWDSLPIGGSDAGSIVRLDHVFPIGADPANWQATPHRLSADAMAFIDDWLSWHVTGGLAGGGVLECARATLGGL